MGDRLRTAFGVLRSLRIYYGNRSHSRKMDALYARFVRDGDLVFDIGAHVGDRIAAFRRLGARVVAAEPQPALLTTLRLLYGRDRNVTLAPAAVGRTSGRTTMTINLDNPTISTASRDFIRSAKDAKGWEGQRWDKEIEVAVVTLDDLIGAHGNPAFIKIDVEGFEAEALAGLSNPVPALSFEFTTIQRDVALECIGRCAELGYGRFAAALGESQELGAWRTADEMARWLRELPHEANSGDIYAQMA
jgi:FkbM family methyltransferase